MAQGSFGRVRIFEDFLGMAADYAGDAPASDVVSRVGNLSFVGVAEGTVTMTVDEPGGIVALTTSGNDNDNACLFAGPFKPSDGGVVMEVRFKMEDIASSAVFAGWTETLNQTTAPVMPAESTGATPTLTISGSGGVAGMLHDKDNTTAVWRAVAGDGGTVASDLTTSTGTVSTAPVNDEFDIVRVEMDVNGDAKIIHNGKVIDDVAACVTASDYGFMCVMLEERAATTEKLEVDYFYAEGGRDWTV